MLAKDRNMVLEKVVELRNLRLAIDTLQMIAKQRGCEHFDPAVSDGKLTTLIGSVVFG